MFGLETIRYLSTDHIRFGVMLKVSHVPPVTRSSLKPLLYDVVGKVVHPGVFEY